MKTKPVQLQLSDANNQYVKKLQCPTTDVEQGSLSVEDKITYLVNQARLQEQYKKSSPPHILALNSLLEGATRLPAGTNQSEAAAFDAILAWLPETVSFILSQKKKHDDLSCFREIDGELGYRVRQLLSHVVLAEHVLANNLHSYMKLDATNTWPSCYQGNHT